MPPSVIASEAKQSRSQEASVDCFVASLLAMTLSVNIAARAAKFNDAGGKCFPGESARLISPVGILAAGAALDALLKRRQRRAPHRHVPDILGIFADRAVARKPGHPRDIEDAGAGPGGDHLPAR